ncbi:hypothetical protein W822_16595 [Advenella kashmirensis W13003]|uniref:Uncharacterized protein n=1 Tax=Advenella kashmirensis W13003 TaxID=1424334 RepID=V8QR47_9BURK|nr:hypothetical protein [Advenella kashmirensis]ETF02451.1 hypothetical protein W822_16595 [Advenella kashmirensis W13003]
MNAAYQQIHIGLIRKAINNYKTARSSGNKNVAKGYMLQVRDLIRAFKAIR